MLRQEELDRRTLVQGTGAAIALPFLDAMFPALAVPSPKSLTRMAFVYVPNGIIMEAWTPGDGRANRPVTCGAFSGRSPGAESGDPDRARLP